MAMVLSFVCGPTRNLGKDTRQGREAFFKLRYQQRALMEIAGPSTVARCPAFEMSASTVSSLYETANKWQIEGNLLNFVRNPSSIARRSAWPFSALIRIIGSWIEWLHHTKLMVLSACFKWYVWIASSTLSRYVARLNFSRICSVHTIFFHNYVMLDSYLWNNNVVEYFSEPMYIYKMEYEWAHTYLYN